MTQRFFTLPAGAACYKRIGPFEEGSLPAGLLPSPSLMNFL